MARAKQGNIIQFTTVDSPTEYEVGVALDFVKGPRGERADGLLFRLSKILGGTDALARPLDSWGPLQRSVATGFKYPPVKEGLLPSSANLDQAYI